MVKYLDQTGTMTCPYGDVRRVITGGAGSANIHVVCVTKGGAHVHRAYDEVYYILSGTGTLTMDTRVHELRPGAVVNIPAGTVHALKSDDDAPLEFIIFGTPPMSIEDERAKPQKP